jgi:hypothetical protein
MKLFKLLKKRVFLALKFTDKNKKLPSFFQGGAGLSSPPFFKEGLG